MEYQHSDIPQDLQNISLRWHYPNQVIGQDLKVLSQPETLAPSFLYEFSLTLFLTFVKDFFI